MNNTVADYFDSMASSWDEKNIIDKSIINSILDIAGISEGKTVLDAGCGTGVLIPFLLERGVKSITALDVSPKMTEAARKKFPRENITFVCDGIESCFKGEDFDCVIVHNAFPHFLERDKAVESLKSLTKPGGRLTVAHSISREAVLRCHENIPFVSLALPHTDELTDILRPEIFVDNEISNEKMYVVSGIKGAKQNG